jgi:hypothetical protein
MSNLTEFVKFDTTGWRLDGSVDDNPVVWLFPGGGGIGLYYFNVPPDIPPNATMDELLAHERSELHEMGGGLLEYEVAKFADVHCIRSVVKVRSPGGSPRGLTYLASLTIPFHQRSFVIKAQCSESGVSGTREAVVMDRAMAEGTVKLDGDELLGWALGPHNANLSEDPSLDTEFPEHPLSRARAGLRQATASLMLSPQLVPESAFPLPLGN